jgi:hypothetical protein
VGLDPDATWRRVRTYREQGRGDQEWNLGLLHNMSVRIVLERQGITKKSRVGAADGAGEKVVRGGILLNQHVLKVGPCRVLGLDGQARDNWG